MRYRTLPLLTAGAVMLAGMTFGQSVVAEAVTSPSSVAATLAAARDAYFANWVPTQGVSLGWTGNTGGCVTGDIST